MIATPQDKSKESEHTITEPIKFEIIRKNENSVDLKTRWISSQLFDLDLLEKTGELKIRNDNQFTEFYSFGGFGSGKSYTIYIIIHWLAKLSKCHGVYVEQLIQNKDSVIKQLRFVSVKNISIHINQQKDVAFTIMATFWFQKFWCRYPKYFQTNMIL